MTQGCRYKLSSQCWLLTLDHDDDIDRCVYLLLASSLGKYSLCCAGPVDGAPGVHPPKLAELSADACAVRPAGRPGAPLG